jgi:aspartate dehydrogenase
MRRVGLIGFGAIGTTIVDMWARMLSERERLAAVLARRRQIDQATRRVPPNTLVTADVASFLDCDLDVIIEAAGHGAIDEYAERILLEGCELHVLSTGALANKALRQRLQAAAMRGQGRIVIPTGALAGFDGLLSMRTAGLISVKYTSAKPVHAWRNTPAERSCRLDELTGPHVIFAGTAEEAARDFPRNANLAAAVALAGMGFEGTQVELVADPTITDIVARIQAVSVVGQLDLTLTSIAFNENPKTSQITAMSAITALHDREELIRFC